jgi:hypothetical protein
MSVDAPNYSEHPDELWLDCVKPRAEQQHAGFVVMLAGAAMTWMGVSCGAARPLA